MRENGNENYGMQHFLLQGQVPYPHHLLSLQRVCLGLLSCADCWSTVKQPVQKYHLDSIVTPRGIQPTMQRTLLLISNKRVCKKNSAYCMYWSIHKICTHCLQWAHYTMSKCVRYKSHCILYVWFLQSGNSVLYIALSTPSNVIQTSSKDFSLLIWFIITSSAALLKDGK